jgi:hypothetical protein
LFALTEARRHGDVTARSPGGIRHFSVSLRLREKSISDGRIKHFNNQQSSLGNHQSGGRVTC